MPPCDPCSTQGSVSGASHTLAPTVGWCSCEGGRGGGGVQAVPLYTRNEGTTVKG